MLTGALDLPTESYYIQEGLVNHRQYYLNAGKTKGIWFNGESGTNADWMMGRVSNLQAENYTYGWMQSNSNDDCPSALAF